MKTLLIGIKKGEKEMKRINKSFYLIIVLSIVLFFVGCAPKALYMQGGEKLDQKIRSQKTTVAVLPTIDWAEDEGCLTGYLLYGCSGIVTRDRAYNDAGLLVTNKITEAMWKKNKVKLSKKEVIIEKMKSSNLQPEEIFPKPDYTFLKMSPKPILDVNDVGESNPNYDKLYKLGEEIGADVILISRISRNTQTGICPQNPIGAFPPLTTILGVGQYLYRGYIAKTKNVYVVLDIMALDIKNKEVIAFGGFNKINQIPSEQKTATMESYTKSLTFYAPLPEKEDLLKDFYANAASMASTQIANYIINYSTGLSLAIKFDFDYEFEDETWKMYPAGTFEKDYGLSKSEYLQLINQ